ncbi:hypothetical protein L4C34_15265 [Vibrio profundum]|uniref:SulA-like leucine-rich domain-containing protein n=1 Tax=Vibrio profundum TaxID=2910247 RepID=UPI003D0A76B5
MHSSQQYSPQPYFPQPYVPQTSSLQNKPSYPGKFRTLDHTFISQLETLSEQDQWILLTAECPRLNHEQLSQSKVSFNKIIQMKPSHSQSELQIVIRAIKAGNASAVVASDNIELVNQGLLKRLAKRHSCEVFFV